MGVLRDGNAERLRELSISIYQRASEHALKRNIIAYVPQSEEVDWNFPVLVEDVVTTGSAAIQSARVRLTGAVTHMPRC